MQRRPWLLLLLAALPLAGCGRDPNATADPAAARATTPPASAPAASAPASASNAVAVPVAPSSADPAFESALAPLRDVEIAARAAGMVTRLDAEIGDRVAEGARLAQLDDREARATLAEREAEVTRTQSAWDRAQKLKEQNVVSEEEFLNARAAIETARAQRDRAALEVEHCAVTAPIGGVVMQRRVQRGQSVKVGDPLFRIADPSVLRAELLLPEAMLGAVRDGQPVRLVPASGPAVPARITRVVPIVDPASGTFRVTIDLDNRHAHLPAGITVRVDLGTAAAAR